METCNEIGLLALDYRERINTLQKELLDASDELRMTRTEVVIQTKAKEEALKEVQRLKAGEFTDEELNSLCHLFSTDKVCLFRRGCSGYQVKLFGQEAVRADIARELRYALKQIVYKDGADRLAELLAEVLVPEQES